MCQSRIKNEVEFNIPYPIEDYPDGTDIIITSHPMDNLDENIGYFVSSGEEVIVNMETTETYPVIIVWPSTTSYNEIVKASTEENINSAKNLNKQESGNNLKAASTTYITDMTNWNREDLGHMIKIRYIYVKDDHRTGLFAPNSIVYLSTASVEFDSSTKITYKVTGTGNALPGVFSKTILPKWVRWAEDGYSKGWIDVGEQIVFSDWQPAITNSTFAGWVDRPNKEGESKVDLTAIVKVIIALISPELAVLNAFSDEMITYTKTQTAVADVVYGQVPMTRNAYKYLYNSAGTTWGEVGEKTFPVSGYGQRPALQINSDLLYITTWETFPIN